MTRLDKEEEMMDFDSIVQERAEEFALNQYNCRLEWLREDIQAELCSEAAHHVCENAMGDYGVTVDELRSKGVE